MKRVFASILAVLVEAFSGVAAAAVREPVEPLAVSSEAREDSSHVAMLDDGDAILWGDGLAALSFPEGQVPRQFYARLSARRMRGRGSIHSKGARWCPAPGVRP